MCTAVTYRAGHPLFGRNLDLEHTLGESVAITPRNFPLPFRRLPDLRQHHAIIGAAHIADNFPLYYDAMNEMGLAAAGLNFPGHARYQPFQPGQSNVAPFELIPWLLGQCSTVEQAQNLLETTNLLDQPFRADLPLTPLHWIIADRGHAIVLEPLPEGLKIYDAPAGVLTNSPPFPVQMAHLTQFLSLSPVEPGNRLLPALSLRPESRGTGSLGLPGDFSSPSRFVRAAFLRSHSRSGPSEEACVSQFFHILDGVALPRGCVQLEDGRSMLTQYTACCCQDTGVYYYTTYENRQITAVSLFAEDLDGSRLVSYPMNRVQQMCLQNQP